MTDSYAQTAHAKIGGAWTPAPARPLLLGWSGHWPLVVVACAALITWGVRDEPLTAQVGSAFAVAGAYVVADRWGCWRWLAAAAALPVALAPMTDLDAWGVLALAGVGAAVVVARWRAATGRTGWIAGIVLLAVAFLLSLPAETLDHGPVHGHPSLFVISAFCLAIAASAIVGLGRAKDTELRLTGLLLLVLPVVVAPASGYPSLLVLACWPMAAAVGVTALLRGGRGTGANRPQTDEVDQIVMAKFAADAPKLKPVAIVIAAYNEANGLPQVLDALPTEVCGLPVDVIVVDDGSADGTAEALADSRAYVASCPVNRGQGAALRLGYRLAREYGARYIITTDADGQYDVDDMPAVLTPILDGEADFVTGSRVLGQQHTRDKVRRTGVHVFAWLATFLTGQRLTDTSFGLRAMRAEVTGAVTLNQPQYQSSELLLGTISHGFRVKEVPGTMHVRSAGTTKKGRNVVYGSNYAKVMTTTWCREGAPRPVAEWASAYRTQAPAYAAQPGTTATPSTD